MADWNSQPRTPTHARGTNGTIEDSLLSGHIAYQSSPTRGTAYAWGSGNPSSTTVTDRIGQPTAYRKTHSSQYYQMLENRRKLPIWLYKDGILQLIQDNQVVVIEGETGSGKSTQVPQWCLELPGIKQVVCTQPRRIAAISLAHRVAHEMDVRVGHEVGFLVRFDHKVSPKTVLRYVTDGTLLRETMKDRTLSSYDVIIIDEVHERRTVTDILLGVIKETLLSRPDLKLIIMSATLNANKFCEFFDGCPQLHIPGKMFPVEKVFSPNVIQRVNPDPSGKNKYTPDFVFYAINVALDLCVMNKTEGDILIFVTGREEIDFICRNLTKWLDDNNILKYISIIPLYGDLPYHSQQKIFDKSPSSSLGNIGRKCIVATNIAETSITIDGVVFVIDSGKVKLSSVAGGGHMKSLLPVDISQSSANQRAGRAGRTRPGKCFRLYPDHHFKAMDKDTIPEILRCDLSDVILQLTAMKVNLQQFESLDQPSPESLANATNNLNVLGALDTEGNITEVGIQMSLFPVDPEVARMLVASKEYSCQEDILSLAAMLSGDRPGSVFLRGGKDKDKVHQIQSKLHHSSGDHLTNINVYSEFVSNGCSEDWCEDNYIYYRILWEAEKIREQLLVIMTQLKLMPNYAALIPRDNYANVLKAILTGYIGNIAQHNPSSNSMTFGDCRPKFTTVRNSVTVSLHPSCVYSSFYVKPVFCYSSCVRTNPKQNYISIVSCVEEEWYDEIRQNQIMQGQAVLAPALRDPRLGRVGVPPIQVGIPPIQVGVPRIQIGLPSLPSEFSRFDN